MIRFLLLAAPLLGFAIGQDGDRDLAAWIQQLGDPDPSVREAARGRILDRGEKALPSLRKAAEDANVERRGAVRDLIHRIERKSFWGRDLSAGLTDEERDFLAPIHLLQGLRDPGLAGDSLTDARRLPDDMIWEFIPATLLPEPEVAMDLPAGADPGPVRSAAIRSVDAMLSIRECPDPQPSSFGAGRYPRLYVLERSKVRQDLSQLKLPAKGGEKAVDIAGLTGVPAPKDHGLHLEDLKEFKGKEGRTGYYFRFQWSQLKPFPNLRHLLVKERWILMVIDYQ